MLQRDRGMKLRQPLRAAPLRRLLGTVCSTIHGYRHRIQRNVSALFSVLVGQNTRSTTAGAAPCEWFARALRGHYHLANTLPDTYEVRDGLVRAHVYKWDAHRSEDECDPRGPTVKTPLL